MKNVWIWTTMAVVMVTACSGENPLFAGAEASDDGGIVEDSMEADSGTKADLTTDDGCVDGDFDASLPDLATTPPDITTLPDLAPPPDLAQVLVVDCSVSRTSCRSHLTVGCTKSGAFEIDVNGRRTKVWCDQTSMGGGWALAYSNANNWANEGASTIASVNVNGSLVAKWYDSRWWLRDAADAQRLGKTWNGVDPLTPDVVGSNDLRALYDSGNTDVRIDFEQGSNHEIASGWCSTDGSWDWSTSNGQVRRCKSKNNGSNAMICLSSGVPCDGHDGNAGWIGSISLGDQLWDYAYQSAPNHLNLGRGCDGVGYPCTVSAFVALWKQVAFNANAWGKDYQIRVWLRAPL